MNECDERTHNCHENATCSDVVGGFDCSCNTGFTGNGTFCEGKLSSALEHWSRMMLYFKDLCMIMYFSCDMLNLLTACTV